MVVSIEGFFWHSFQEFTFQSHCITGLLITAKYETGYFLTVNLFKVHSYHNFPILTQGGPSPVVSRAITPIHGRK